MPRPFGPLVGAGLLFAAFSWPITPAATDSAPPLLDPELFAAASTGFVPHAGQWSHGARFVFGPQTHGGGEASLFVEDDGWVAVHHRGTRGSAVRLRFDGAQPSPPTGVGRLPGVHHYLRGKDPARWRTGVPRYAAVRYREVYDGVDVLLREGRQGPEYDLLLAPGADLARVRIRVEGAARLLLDGDALRIDTGEGQLRQPAPTTWQVLPDGTRRPVRCDYVLHDAVTFGFAVTDHDPDLALVVDPALLWSTAVPGGAPAQSSTAYGVGRDPGGLVVIAGATSDPAYPTTLGALRRLLKGSTDAFVTRLDPSAAGPAQLVDSTYLGGEGNDGAQALVLDTSGVVTVAGNTNSNEFPTTLNAFDRRANGRADLFVAQLDLSLSGTAQLRYGSYLGGSQADLLKDLALAPNGAIVVLADTASPDFPTSAGAYDPTYQGGTASLPFDAAVARLDPSLPPASQLYATFVGGSSWEAASALALTSTGLIAAVVETFSTDVPTTAGAYATAAPGGIDAVVVLLDATQSGAAQLVYGSYLGGEGNDVPHALAVAPDDSLVVGGDTASMDFPTTPGAWLTTHGPAGFDGFVAQLDPSAATPAAQLRYSTLVVGSGEDSISTVAVDSGARIVVGGETGSLDFPTTSGAYATTHGGGFRDLLVLRLDPSQPAAGQLDYSTLLGGTTALGGTGENRLRALHVDSEGVVTAAGTTDTGDFPTTPGAYAATTQGGVDQVFVLRLDLLPTGADRRGSSSPGCRGALAIGCAGGSPRPGNTAFAFHSGNATPGAVGALVLGAPAPTPFAVLGFALWVDPTTPTVFVPTVANGLGAARTAVPVPPKPSLVGQTLGAQYVWVEACPPSGFAATAGLAITVQP